MISRFLDQFLFNSSVDLPATKQPIDISLALRSLPFRVSERSCYRVGMISFAGIKKSLISFQNDDLDELFQYYDTRSKKRVNKVTAKAAEIRMDTKNLRQVGSTVLSILKKINFVGNVFGRKKNGKNNYFFTKEELQAKKKDRFI